MGISTMIEQLLSSDFVSKIFKSFADVFSYLHINISELNNIKLIALSLIISALIIFLMLIVIVILHNIICLFRRNPASVQKNSAASSGYNEDSVFSEEEQQELELELQKELDLALAQRAELEKQKEQEQEQQEISKRNKEKDENIRKQQEIEEKENKEQESSFVAKHKRNIDIDLDWQKQKIPAASSVKTEIDTSMLSYKQDVSKLHDLLGLLVDMFGRGIDDIKIAQTLNYKTQGLSDENDILKLISAVKSFITLCQSDKFYRMDNYDELPDVGQALYHLANNDVTLALVLLENLMDKSVDKAAAATENKKQQIFTEVSDYACCLGTLAEINDIMLATSVYEMAIELNSSNATAWSRLGDIYRSTNSESKAIWAYQNAYSFADSEINPAELANASQNLSNYLYTQGNTLQATKMHNIAKQYYDSLGINNRFSKQEIDALAIIESNHQQILPDLIDKLLQRTA